MKKIRLEKYCDGVYKITWPKGKETRETVTEETQDKVDDFETEPKTIKDLLVEVDRTDEGRSLLGNGDGKKNRKVEEFYKTCNTPATPKDVRKYLVETDKIIDKEL
jgi:hypothetical protein